MKITSIENIKNYVVSSTQKTKKIRVIINPLGKAGFKGKSAYQYAVDAGYTGNEDEFTMLMVNPEFTIAEQEAQTDWDNINT